MSETLTLLAPVLAVVGLAVAVLLLDAFGVARGRAAGLIALVGLVGAAALTVSSDVHAYAAHGEWLGSPWSIYLQRLFLAAAFLGVLGAMDWLERAVPTRAAEYVSLLLMSVAGMMLLPGARDWILLLVAFELMGIPLYLLAAWGKGDTAPDRKTLAGEGAFKLFVTGATSSALTLFGVALVVGATGSTAISSVPGSGSAPIATAGMLLVLAGMGFKVGAVPFHMWVPDAYQGAPVPFVAFLSVAPKAAGFAALVIVLDTGWGDYVASWGVAVAALSALSMVFGNLFAVPQTDARRLLGYSGVAQVGYALAALAANTEFGLSMALFFLAAYVFTNMGAFLVLHAAADGSCGHSLGKIAGLSRRSPWLGGAMLVFLLSLAGIPFVIGFWAKVFVFLSVYEAGLAWLVVVGVAFTVVGLWYYLQVARSTFMSDGEGDAPVRAGVALHAAIGLCLAAVVGLGLVPAPLVDAAREAGATLWGERYPLLPVAMECGDTAAGCGEPATAGGGEPRGGSGDGAR